PAVRQQIERRGLLGEDDRIVPGQGHHRGAEPQAARACGEPGEQRERGSNLIPSAEMVLDQKGGVIAQRFGFDVEIDEVMKALAHRSAGTAASLDPAENAESHAARSLRGRRPAARLRGKSTASAGTGPRQSDGLADRAQQAHDLNITTVLAWRNATSPRSMSW